MKKTSIEELRLKTANTLGISDHSEFFTTICNILEEQEEEIEILKGKTFNSMSKGEEFSGPILDRIDTFLIEIARNNNMSAVQKASTIREFFSKLDI